MQRRLQNINKSEEARGKNRERKFELHVNSKALFVPSTLLIKELRKCTN
jgi:hypothetical protein